MRFGDERLPERFWEKVIPEPNTGCWLWLGSSARGYSQFWFSPRTQPGHRVILMVAGHDLDGLVVDHLCRQPSCVNPAHLEPVTHAENCRRGMSGAMQTATQTHCKNGHPLAGDNLYVNKQEHYTSRQCIACARVAKRRYKRKIRAHKKAANA